MQLSMLIYHNFIRLVILIYLLCPMDELGLGWGGGEGVEKIR